MNHRKAIPFTPHRFAFLGVGSALVFLAGCGTSVPRGPVADAKLVAEIRSKIVSTSAPKEATAGPAASGTGWAKLSGVIKISGEPSSEKPLEITKEQGICSPGGGAVFARTLVVDPATKGVANVVLYVHKAPRAHESAAAPATDQPVFDQKACLFSSRVLVFRVNQTISLKNSDPIGHNIHFDDKCESGALNSSVQGNSATPYKAVKEDAAPYGVNCDIHPWMKSFMMARNNGYFSVTKPDGAFEIANLPAGEELEFRVWHERLKNASVEASGIKIEKGKFKLKLAENEEKNITIELPAAGFSAQ